MCECQAGPRTVLTDCIISVHNRCLGLNIQSGVNQHSAYVPSHRGRLMCTKEPSRCIILCNSPPIYKSVSLLAIPDPGSWSSPMVAEDSGVCRWPSLARESAHGGDYIGGGTQARQACHDDREGWRRDCDRNGMQNLYTMS